MFNCILKFYYDYMIFLTVIKKSLSAPPKSSPTLVMDYSNSPVVSYTILPSVLNINLKFHIQI